MELFANGLERRWDPKSGFFRPPPGFNQEPQFRATELASMAISNTIDYCRILLSTEHANLLQEQVVPKGEVPITAERITRLLVRSMGISSLAKIRVKEALEHEREQKINSSQTTQQSNSREITSQD